MSLMDMLKVEEPEVKEKKAVKPKLKKEVTEKTQQPAEGKAEQPKAKGTEKEASGKKYTFPFILWMDRQQQDVSHIFEVGKEYSESEISNHMLEHGDYDFGGKVNYDYLPDKNVLAVSFQKHSKG